jgi:hypothetical protein
MSILEQLFEQYNDGSLDFMGLWKRKEEEIKRGSFTDEQYTARERRNMEDIMRELFPSHDPYEKLRTRVNSLCSQSIDYLAEKLYDDHTPNNQVADFILALGKDGSVKAKEVLGEVYTRKFPRSIDNTPVQHSEGTARFVSKVLKKLGPPPPQTLINAISDKYYCNWDRERMELIYDVVTATAGPNIEDRLKAFLSSNNSPKNQSRVREIIFRIKKNEEDRKRRLKEVLSGKSLEELTW